MAGTIVADNIQAASTSTLVLKNGVANTPPTIQDSAGTQIGTFCRAWVNFNGTSTVAIRASFNVSSITDNGTGDYTVNLTTAMPDVNFVTNVTVRREAAFGGPPATAVDQYAATSRPNTTTSTTVFCGDQAALRDSSIVVVSVFR
jgi:hypothetical protein